MAWLLNAACTDEHGRAVCVHVDSVLDRPKGRDVVVTIDPSNPLRCSCPACGKEYQTPHALALRILWEAVAGAVDREQVRLAIERIQKPEGAAS